MAIAKQIQDYPDYYVSSAGNVWREKNNGFFLKIRPSKEGGVSLCTNGKIKQMYIHRLVAQAFVPIPSKYEGTPIEELEVHHIDFNHSNNRESNLQWLTKSEHQKLHSESDITHLRKSKPKSDEHKRNLSAALKGENNPMYGKPKPEGSGKPPKPVMQFTKDGEFIAEYASVMDAARQTKVNNRNICSCCIGKLKSAGGYKWRYAA